MTERLVLMIYRKIGKTEIEASAIGLGTWAIGGGDWWGDSDDEASIKTIQEAIKAGITLIDTAPGYGYGRSEEIVGKAVAGMRDKLILSTKCGLWWGDDRGSMFFEQSGHQVKRCLDPDTIRAEVELSLKRLGTDYIDIYFTHWQSMPPYETPVEKTMDCLMDLKRQGLIKAIGASNVTSEHIAEYEKFGTLDVIQEKYSMLDRGLEKNLLDDCIGRGISAMAYSPLEQGLLTGKVTMDYQPGELEARAGNPWYVPGKRRLVLDMLESFKPLTQKYNCTLSNLVIAWTMAQQGVDFVLCGARKPQHIAETAQSAILLDTADIAMMRDAVEMLG